MIVSLSNILLVVSDQGCSQWGQVTVATTTTLENTITILKKYILFPDYIDPPPLIFFNIFCKLEFNKIQNKNIKNLGWMGIYVTIMEYACGSIHLWGRCNPLYLNMHATLSNAFLAMVPKVSTDSDIYTLHVHNSWSKVLFLFSLSVFCFYLFFFISN